MRRVKLVALLSALVVGGTALCPPAFALRFIRIELFLDGKVVLSAGTSDDGTESAEAVWGQLKTVALKPVGAFKVSPDVNNPLLANLQGKLLLKVNYGGRAEISELALVRKTADSNEWLIAPAEVERLRKVRMLP